MNRYLSSFIISIFIYTSLFAGAIAFFVKDENFSDKKLDKPNVISVSMISEPVVKKEPIKKKVIEKKKEIVKKKPVKKVVKKKPLPKPKKVIPKQEVVKEEVTKKETLKEELVKEDVPKVKSAQTEKKQQVIVNKKTHINHDEIKAKQNIFFTKLRNRINENKSYPRRARRRGIEGNVEVKFHLLSNGNVKNIEFLSGKKIFKKSVLEAIENSFPIEVDKSLFSFPKEFKISVKYVLS